jgi:excisionase family DNA binding protein
MRERVGAKQPPREGGGVVKNNVHVVSVEEAADLLGIGRNSAYHAIKEGRFPVRVIQLGARYLIPRAELEELLGIRPAATVSREP